jgi:nucleotide-binding universal stress UspA family protein
MTKSDRVSTPRNILLATDLGSRSDRALDRSAQLAQQWGAQLHIVHCLTSSPAFPASVRDGRRQEADDPRASAEQRIRADLGPLAETLQPAIHIESRNPGQAILDVANKQKCSLIVTGVARDETLGRRLLGDTVDFLARKASVPVLVVRKRTAGPYETVIAASDFSAASAEAVKAAATLFPASRLSLLHAYSIPFSSILMNDKIRAEFQELGAQAALEFLRSQGLPQDLPHIVEQGTPEQIVASHVDPRGSLIVIGSHGASALATMVLGSTARRILNRTEGDVMLVPFTGREGRDNGGTNAAAGSDKDNR